MTLHFKSSSSYHKFLAYKHMHIGKSSHPQKVTIAGKPHKVDHGFYGDDLSSVSESRERSVKVIGNPPLDKEPDMDD